MSSRCLQLLVLICMCNQCCLVQTENTKGQSVEVKITFLPVAPTVVYLQHATCAGSWYFYS